MSAVIERYQAKLAERGYTADSAQLAAIERLQRLADELQGFDNRPGGLLKRLMSRGKTPPRGDCPRNARPACIFMNSCGPCTRS